MWNTSDRDGKENWIDKNKVFQKERLRIMIKLPDKRFLVTSKTGFKKSEMLVFAPTPMRAAEIFTTVLLQKSEYPFAGEEYQMKDGSNIIRMWVFSLSGFGPKIWVQEDL